MVTTSKRVLISAESEEEVNQIAELLQDTIDTVDNQDLIKLLTSVKNKPSIVKTALSYLK